MLRIEMLPAAHGDSILVEWADPGSLHRMLVDAGPHFTYPKIRERLRARLGSRPFLDLLVITHIDADHLEGAIRLLQDRALGLCFGDIWFNDYSKLEQLPSDVLGATHGEFLGALIDRDRLPWNRAFGKGAVVLEEEGEPRVLKPLAGLEMTLLSPGPSHLVSLRNNWQSVLDKVDFRPGDRDHSLAQLEKRAKYEPPRDVLGKEPDTSEANGSSIALLIQYEGKKALLTGDSFPQTLEETIVKLPTPLKVDAFKLSHHGSFSSTSKKLLQMAPAEHYLISTNGRSSAKHPDKWTLELIKKAVPAGTKPSIVFNYRGKYVDPWVEAASRGDITIQFLTDSALEL